MLAYEHKQHLNQDTSVHTSKVHMLRELAKLVTSPVLMKIKLLSDLRRQG